MISCIVLAAGKSARFGSPKPLVQIGTRTVIESLQEKLLSSQLAETIVVLGHQAETISPLISKGPRLKYVVNPRYELGQTSSFKTGLAAADPNAKGFMLLPADMPFIETDTIDELIHVFLKKSPLILVPCFRGRRGHPPVFSAQLKDELMGLVDDAPLSDVLHKHASDVLEVPLEEEGIILSFNTPQDLEKILKRRKQF